jgi:hypothetical protein
LIATASSHTEVPHSTISGIYISVIRKFVGGSGADVGGGGGGGVPDMGQLMPSISGREVVSVHGARSPIIVCDPCSLK